MRVSWERDELVLMVVGPRWKNLDDLETLCPEYSGLRLEYPGRVSQALFLQQNTPDQRHRIARESRDNSSLTSSMHQCKNVCTGSPIYIMGLSLGINDAVSEANRKPLFISLI